MKRQRRTVTGRRKLICKEVGVPAPRKRRASPPKTVVVKSPAPRPVVVTAAPAPRRRSVRRGKRAASIGGTNKVLAIALASAALGLFEQSELAKNIPTIPVIGRKGAIAIASYFYSKNGGGQLASDVCIAAAALSGYELATKGEISGDYE